MWLHSGCRAVAVVFVSAVVISCSPSEQDVRRVSEETVATAIASIPRPTSAPTVTPQPTPTPIELPPTVTPALTPTPQPSATPVIFAPDASPQPTATPQPTPTPQPTLRPYPNFNKVYLSAWPSVFRVDTREGSGSGWLVSPGHILTNHHVVEGGDSVTVRQADSPSFPAVVAAVDLDRDIALLRFDEPAEILDPRAKPLPLGTITSDDVAKPLLILGYDGALALTVNGAVGKANAHVGVLSLVLDLRVIGRGVHLVIDATVDPGDSGGPVLNSDGQVIGMTRSVDEGTLFAIPVDEIHDSLSALTRGEGR